MKIKYLKNRLIDKEAYDSCINQSPNPKVYAYSWYLDHMTMGNWDALVTDDYSYVFPLPFNYKFGFLRYNNIPPFVQQLGIFGKNVDASIVNCFLSNLSLNSIVTRQFFNASNLIEKPLAILPNYQLVLDDYEIIKKDYKQDLKNNLKKIDFNNVEINSSACIKKTIDLFKKTYPIINDNRYLLFEKVANTAIEKGNGVNYSFHLNGKELAYTFFLKNHKYIHYILPGPTEFGRKHSIIQSILDYVIKSNCGKDLILDFEGSSIPNVALLYKKYNPYTEEYFLKNIWWPQVLIKKLSFYNELSSKNLFKNF